MEKISIIIPVYNQARLLEKCVSSFCKQGDKNVEVIVVDDGSIDAIKEVIKKFKKEKRVRWFKQKNLGPSAARNLAYRKMKGKALLFIDADQEVPLNFITEVRRAFLYADAIYIPEKSASDNFWTKCIEYERKILYDHTGRGVPRGYKKALIGKIGFFDEKLKFGEDWELFQRAKKVHARFIQLNAVMIHHEVESPLHTINKYVKYGRKSYLLLKKEKTAVTFYSAIDRKVVKNAVKYFFKNPLLFCGSAVYRAVKTVCAAVGYIKEKIKAI
ncbi:MAG: glycosyltransferase family A protein [Candidatus Nanoarchaeia archaeon]